MSTDYSVACDTCEVYRHLGQRYANAHYSFGYGKSDDKLRNKILEWVEDHLSSEHKVSIYLSQFKPDRYKPLETYDD